VKSDDDEDMLELRPDPLWSERLSTVLLEDQRHYVVADVAFSQQLVSRKHNRINILRSYDNITVGRVQW